MDHHQDCTLRTSLMCKTCRCMLLMVSFSVYLETREDSVPRSVLSQCGPISTLVDETRGLNDTPRFCNQSICICILSSRLTSPLPPSPLFKSSADANFASLFALFCRPLLASISDQQSPLNAERFYRFDFSTAAIYFNSPLSLWTGVSDCKMQPFRADAVSIH